MNSMTSPTGFMNGVFSTREFAPPPPPCILLTPLSGPQSLDEHYSIVRNKRPGGLKFSKRGGRLLQVKFQYKNNQEMKILMQQTE